MKDRIRRLYEKNLETLATELESRKNNAQAFEVMRYLQTQDRKPFSLKFKDGHILSGPKAMCAEAEFFNPDSFMFGDIMLIQCIRMREIFLT